MAVLTLQVPLGQQTCRKEEGRRRREGGGARERRKHRHTSNQSKGFFQHPRHLHVSAQVKVSEGGGGEVEGRVDMEH